MAKGLVNVNEHNVTSVQELLTEGDEGAEADEELDRVDIGKELERVKWSLWHGNVTGAITR